MSKKDYYELPLFKNIYFEDSYVLNIIEGTDLLEFRIEAVLTEQNPYYSLPKKDEQYCYKKIAIQFSQIVKKEWVIKNLKYSEDINGERDLGNIDSFTIDDNTYDIQGAWGHIIIESTQVAVYY